MGKAAVDNGTRERIISLVLHTELSQREIARRIGVSDKCVRTTIKNYRARGSVAEAPRIGRPNALSYYDKKWIFRQARIDPKLSNRALTEMFNSKAVCAPVSTETVRKALLEKGLKSYTATRKPLLSVLDRIKRRKWCKARLHWTIDEWRKVIFSDESNFEVVNRKTRVTVKRLASEKYQLKFCQPRIQGGGGSAGIWGCISHKGTGCCEMYKGRINQHTYRNTLENQLLPSVDLWYGESTSWLFMQDGAPAHTAKSIKDWFDENQVVLLPWCARSPDLNPIENIWAWMDRRLSRENLKSIEELMERVEALWHEVPREIVMKLIESMPKRVRACYKAKGGHFSY